MIAADCAREHVEEVATGHAMQLVCTHAEALVKELHTVMDN